MKFIVSLAGGSVLTAIVFNAVSGLTGLGAGKEIWFGMFAPAMASVVTWMAIERQKHLNSQKMLKCIIQAFVLKFLFFGVYITVLVKTNQVNPKSFAVCFAFFYLALHIAEAFELRRAQVARLAAGDDVLTGNNQ